MVRVIDRAFGWDGQAPAKGLCQQWYPTNVSVNERVCTQFYVMMAEISGSYFTCSFLKTEMKPLICNWLMWKKLELQSVIQERWSEGSREISWEIIFQKSALIALPTSLTVIKAGLVVYRQKMLQTNSGVTHLYKPWTVLSGPPRLFKSEKYAVLFW